jgi:hypothetical protein
MSKSIAGAAALWRINSKKDIEKTIFFFIIRPPRIYLLKPRLSEKAKHPYSLFRTRENLLQTGRYS